MSRALTNAHPVLTQSMLFRLCELEDSDAGGKRLLFDVCDGRSLLGFVEATVEEIMSAALQGSPLQLRPAPAPRNVLRFVIGLRIDTQGLPRGTQLAISCAAGRRGPSGHLVEVCRAEWTRNGKMQRFLGCGDNAWWQGDVGVARFEMMGADSDGPARLDFGIFPTLPFRFLPGYGLCHKFSRRPLCFTDMNENTAVEHNKA
jgi:hypothetical protein